MTQWNAVTLADVAESVDYGLTASACDQPIGPKFLRITDIQNGAVNWNKVPWCARDSRSGSTVRLKPGDIVFARTGATTGKSYLIRECPVDTVFASYLIRVRLGSGADPLFVSHFFQTVDYWEQITKRTRGVAQPGINATTLSTLRIPLPPVAEQRRIAEILDKADALRAKRRAALAQLDTLSQSIFLEMFGDTTQERLWPFVRFEQIVRETKLGLVRGSDEFASDFPYPYVRMNAITRSGDLEIIGAQRTHASEAEVAAYRLEPGDFLFNTRNSEELVGKSALYRAAGLHLFNNNLMRVRFTAEAAPEFIAAVFKTRFIQHELRLRKSGTTNVFAIYYKDLRSLPIPLPPIDLQCEFSRRMSGLQKLKSTHCGSQVRLDALYSSLQDFAFRGEL